MARFDTLRIRMAAVVAGVLLALAALALTAVPGLRGTGPVALALGLMTGGLVAAYLASRRATRILQELVDAVERVADGDLAHRLEVGPAPEHRQAATAFNRMVDRVATELAARAEAASAHSRGRAHARKTEAVGRLAGGVAHEFNNVLTAISGHAELLLERNRLGPDEEEVVEIKRATDRGASLTRQLLTFSLKHNAELRPTDLNATLRGLEPMLRRGTPDSIRIETRFCDETVFVMAELGRVEQAIMNMVLNATDAMPDGGELTIATALTADADRPVLLTLTDTGRGIPEDVLPNIFDPYYTTKGSGQGTGLGLATVHGIITGMGGRIDVDTRVGHGTTFRITLPRAAAPSTPETQPRHHTHRPDAGSVLVVEDQVAVRRFVVRTLTGRGFQVHEAETPVDALRLVEQGLAPDVVLTDIQMPEMDGPELARRIRQSRPATPILFMSGLGAEEIHWTEDERSAFLQKPFTSEVLTGALLDLLETSVEAEVTA